MSNINFSTTKKDFEVIAAIVDRAAKKDPRLDRITLIMDLSAVHANDCGLKLTDLLEAPPFDFSHDIYGITQHINRETGKLEDLFLPRYAK